jgi:hypothetical protein
MDLFFRALLLSCAVVFTSQTSFANEQDEGTTGLDTGFGYQSDYGLIGIGVRHFVTDSIDIHVSGGVDVASQVFGAGSRIYMSPAFTKCFFFIPCEPLYFAGATLIRSGGGSVTITDSGQSGTFQQSPGYAADLSIGTYDIFSKLFAVGFELGYRSWIAKPSVSYASGSNSSTLSNDVKQMSVNSPTVAITFGFRF